MQCLRVMLIVSLASLANNCTPNEIDSFCYVYNKVILQKGTKIVAPLEVKKRLLANELFYKENCKEMEVGKNG